MIMTFVAAFVAASSSTASIPIRHDIDDTRYHGDANAYPELFGIYRGPSGAPDCIATLIAPNWAITAAHCTGGAALKDALTAGEPYAVEIAGVQNFITSVVQHTASDGAADADLAILKLSESVDHVAPIAIYKNQDEQGRVVIMPGWGGSANGLEGLTHEDGRFRVAENRIDAAMDGWLIWRFDDPRGPLSTALTLEGISGPGDSGGPSFIHTAKGKFIAGISAHQRTYGREEAQYGVEEYFVRVSWYADWIETIISNPAD